MDLHQKFLDLWNRTHGENGESVWRELDALLSHPSRKYHNWNHVEALLGGLDWVRDVAEFAGVRFDEVELAIFFHDAVYDPMAKDNEEKSAGLFAGLAGAHPLIGLDGVSRVVSMIDATSNHAPVTDSSTQLLLDLDLGVLGSPPRDYDRYAANVRAEYAAVPEDLWRAGRPAVLEKFLVRERIFQTDHFNELLETRARENISGEISSLVLS